MPSKKKTILSRIATATVTLLALVAVAVSTGCSSDEEPAKKTTYTGTLYMAGELGGHVVVIPVTIDPSNTAAPFSMGSISRIQLSSGTGTDPVTGNKTHRFHDVRLDGTKLYYSAIFSDTDTTPGNPNFGRVHLGYVDLANANQKHDATIDATMEATSPMMAYCGSGQTATHFFPMTMSYPAYIDSIPKSAITSGASLTAGAGGVVRTFVEDFRADGNYTFAHGVNSPDGTKLFVAVNEATAAGAGTPAGMTGTFTTYLMNTSDVVAGTVTQANVTTGSVPVASGPTSTAFRSTYTPDGTKILQAGKDRIVVLNASNLAVLDNNTAIGGGFTSVENHDAMPTPDGKYAILALRFKHTASEQQDSGIQLYDVVNKTAIGPPVSACNGCHLSTTVAHKTCGIDGKLTTVTQ